MSYTKRQSHIARFFLITLLAVLLLSGCGEEGKSTSSYNLRVTEAAEEFYVNDFAGIFTEEQKASMMDKAIDLDSEYAGIQVVITTVESLQDCVTEGSRRPSIEQVAYAMYNQYGIGQDDMGILVLFSSGDRDVRIETGRQMQAYITDSKSGQLLDNYGMEYFKQDQFAEGLISLQDGIISEIEEIVPNDWNASQEQDLVQKVEEVNQPEEILPSQETVQKESKENQQSKGGIFAILTVFASMVVGLIVSIKKFFSIKGSLKESEREKRQLATRIQLQAESHVEEIQRVRETYTLKLTEIAERHSKEKARYESDIRTYRSEANLRQEEVNRTKEIAEAKQYELKRKLEELDSQKSALQLQLEELQERFGRAQKLHPEFDFEVEVQEMIEKEFREAAREIDQELAKYLMTPASDGAEEYFRSAITYYHNAELEVKKYLETNVQEIQRLCEESRILHWQAVAAEADKKFKQYLGMEADKDKVREFERAIREYEAYPLDVQRYMTTDKSKLYQLCEKSISLRRDFERAEQEKRDKAEAQSIYDVLREVIRNNRKGTHENQQELAEACRKYESMTAVVRSFLPDSTIIQTLRKLLREAEEDTKNWEEAQKAEVEIQRVISRVGYSASESDKDQLERVLQTYRSLRSTQQTYVSEELVRKLKRFLEEAEEDERRNRRRREEERRRSSSSFSSTGGGFSGGSFGGHGGISGGGGASRHF